MTTPAHLSWRIADALLRMQSTDDLSMKLKWALVLTRAKREWREMERASEGVEEK